MYSEYTSNKYMHIFAAANALQFLLINEYINKFKISNKNIIIVDLRELKLLPYIKKTFFPKNDLTKRLLKKSLSLDLTYTKLKRYVSNMDKDFILYVPWDLDLFYQLRTKSNCIGHVYVEEGDLSYWSEGVMYDREKLTERQKRAKLKLPAKRQIFSHDYVFALTIQEDCFPTISKSKKIIIDRFNFVKRFYNPKFKLSNNIGILPAAHRLKNINLDNVLNYYRHYLNPGDSLKMHPSFKKYPDLANKIYKINLKLNNYFEILGNDIILEAELLNKPLNFFGPHSSLERYANAFGGSFTQIKELTLIQEGRG